MDNGLSFVRDFERLLGEDFFRKVKSFTSMRTDAEDLESEIAAYVERLERAGGASHLAYIKPGSGSSTRTPDCGCESIQTSAR